MRCINSKGFRFFLRLVASVASAVVVISGFLFWQNQNKDKIGDAAGDDSENMDEKDHKPAKVHFLHRK